MCRRSFGTQACAGCQLPKPCKIKPPVKRHDPPESVSEFVKRLKSTHVKVCVSVMFSSVGLALTLAAF